MANLIERLFDNWRKSSKRPSKLQRSERSNTGDQVITAPLAMISEAEAVVIKPRQLIVGCGHSTGLQRDHNEDAIFTLTTTMVNNSSHFPFGLYIIADGMGGHVHGELASEIAIRSMSSYVIRKLYEPLFSLKADMPDEPLQEILKEGVRYAHHNILRHTPGGGTTLTAALVLGDQVTIAHIGDSRAYTILPDGTIRALTRDHSLVKRLEEIGQISADEAAMHPQRNVLYRALGQGDFSDPEIATIPLTKGHLLICSDGLWGVITEQEIISVIKSAPYPTIACQELVAAANKAGGPDNISAILVRLPD